MSWKSWVGIGGGIAASFIPGVGPFLGPAIAGMGIAADQADAAKKAAEQQVAAGDKAIDLQRDIYNQTRADLGPYRDVGGQAMGTLGAAMGLPGGGGAPPGPGDPGIGLGRSTTGATMYPDGTTGRIRPPDAPVTGRAQPRAGRLGDAVPVAQQRTASSMTPAGGQMDSSMVRMQSPTGQMVMVPAAKVAEAQQMGGKVVA